jgi:hypothetical protein
MAGQLDELTFDRRYAAGDNHSQSGHTRHAMNRRVDLVLILSLAAAIALFAAVLFGRRDSFRRDSATSMTVDAGDSSAGPSESTVTVAVLTGSLAISIVIILFWNLMRSEFHPRQWSIADKLASRFGWLFGAAARRPGSGPYPAGAVYIPPAGYLRSMLLIAWNAFRHPLSHTTIDLVSGRVVRRTYPGRVTIGEACEPTSGGGAGGPDADRDRDDQPAL